ncbi:hypothetical protein LTR78_010713 [Recurvomyces mirabilis]|uniref:WLM domain-containing protein n=1 Tax=Recurvomyces mirabilis TaxID=574656 RepID=A0AAE0TPY9_9PEZI|nr:hypothetical protein LTR78_010713 [Recurvomyces mirabilis]KAK5159602.1 hypothetical protein LTS14_002744 [Recurvomyces mirabilis]
MPLGLLRRNEKTQRPNGNLNFIKPDAHASPADQAIATDFLSRIAAQCYPVMKENWISVMTLEEHAPNPEFLGRNFNAGECIQLVLKDKRGRWLSFKFVQMVMMHELAHCKQMNHSRFFWDVRNEYAKTMEGLWAKGYKGEGMWGRGKDLESGSFVHDRMPEDAQIPEHLCGGTYRRRGKKRKRGANGREDGGERLTYAERQQKRIQKKFGKHGDGNAIGDDELTRGYLDRMSGKRHRGKPTVAKSKRGRDLRANAALARFEAEKSAKIKQETPELDADDGSETESDYGWSSEDESGSATGKHAGKIQDRNGNDMFKVCGDEAEEDAGGQDEMDELRVLSGRPKSSLRNDMLSSAKPSTGGHDPWPKHAKDDSETESEAGGEDEQITQPPTKATDLAALPVKQSAPTVPTEPGPVLQSSESHTQPTVKQHISSPDTSASPINTTASRRSNCPICSLENDPQAPTCMACAQVLKPSLVKNHWRCRSETCLASKAKYVNAGDVGRCGLCGAKKPVDTARDVGDGRAMGTVGTDVLRWD